MWVGVGACEGTCECVRVCERVCVCECACVYLGILCFYPFVFVVVVGITFILFCSNIGLMTEETLCRNQALTTPCIAPTCENNVNS